MSIYSISAKDIKGNDVSLSEFEGKVLLIVNTATGCGFTPEYNKLEAMYKKYKDKGFEILDFPCNQFGNQAPGTEDEIVSFCQTKFGITFRQFSKIEVNGENEHPLYTYLKSQQGFGGFSALHPLSAIVKKVVSDMDKDYKSNSDIKWNFTKFLVDRSGNVVARFEPTSSISAIEKQVASLL